MLGSENGTSNMDLYALRLRAKKGGERVKPFFAVSKKMENGKYEDIGSDIYDVSGYLQSVKFESYQYEGDTIDTVRLQLVDYDAGENGELYLVSLTYNLLNKNLFNSILNLTDDQLCSKIKISLWENKKGYGSVSLRAGDSLVGWKYSLEELPKAEETTFKGKIMRDYTAVDAFFRKELKKKFEGYSLNKSAISSSPSQENKASSEEPQKQTERKQKDVVDEEPDESTETQDGITPDDFDDIPF